ncbi:PAS domain S-box-containing protein [Lipingzhangella halophila]|uniref:PAS domain S-box-containing protein n=1 Tax=Lipingzhangella halophila TaxID=1783352 RepID=A0A7W7RKB8_9ACTN|nr:SpoIIE family protein phosphatase [Lipingzhangella halophila]MBB4933101.1 PAS domain S-box-containing protein [Lipingzhangella halophila]
MSTETSVPPPRAFGLGPSDAALLETLLDKAPIGFAFLDLSGRFRRVNRTLADVYGCDEGECQGRTPAEVLRDPDDAANHEAAVAAVRQSRAVVYGDHPLVGGTPESRTWALSWFPAYGDDDQIEGVALIAVDAGDSHKVEVALRRSEERYRSLLKAGNQVVWAANPNGEIQEDCPEWRAITGQSVEEYLGRGWLDAVHPDDREPVERAWDDAFADSTTFDESFRVRTQSGDFRYYRSRAIPIMRDGELVEWVGANTDITTQREADEMRQRLTQQLGEAALRTVRLQKATSDLAEALTVDDVVQVMTEIGRSAVGVDRTAVALLDRERLWLRVLNPDGVPDVPGTHPAEAGLDYPGTMSMAVRDRKPFIAGSPVELRALLDDDPELLTFLKHTDEQAWVTLPLLSAGLPIGALRFAFTSQREISDEEKVFLEALAGQCALALGRATLFEREHRTAEALQTSLLPEKLPEVKGVRMKAFYRSGTQHVQVGGDWYDAFPLPDGRVAGVLGDVMGKGIEAATGMSRVRNALRALAFSMPEPADVLTGLDRMFDATEGPDQVTTLVYFVLDPETGQIDLSNAGHLPPLIVAESGDPWLVDAVPDTPLGVSTRRGHHKFFVRPGNTVVLYSDGLVENRKRSVASGLDELVTVASGARPGVVGDPQEMLNYLVGSMLDGYEQDDDVTLLAVHLPVLEAGQEL